ncbi:hypothetical protein FRC02_006208 [Tulasnella sp. 418]|nr:hypothetical protein FRC02_006208 [Tulasnella sp. 418]
MLPAQTQNITLISQDRYSCSYSVKWNVKTPPKLCRTDYKGRLPLTNLLIQKRQDEGPVPEPEPSSTGTPSTTETQSPTDSPSSTGTESPTESHSPTETPSPTGTESSTETPSPSPSPKDPDQDTSIDAIAKTLRVRNVGWQDFYTERKALAKIGELLAHDKDYDGREWIVYTAQKGVLIENHPDWDKYVGKGRKKIDPLKLNNIYGQEDCDHFIMHVIQAAADANAGYVDGCETVHFGAAKTFAFTGSEHDIAANIVDWVEWRNSPSYSAHEWWKATFYEWKTRYPLRNGPADKAGICDS